MTQDLPSYDNALLESYGNDKSLLVNNGIRSDIAEKFAELFQLGCLAYPDVDDRVITSMKTLKLNEAIEIIHQIKNRDLSHVTNKSIFLCTLISSLHQKPSEKAKMDGDQNVEEESKSPIDKIIARTGYSFDVTTGQRKYGGPPPESATSIKKPGKGTEVFCGKIPIDIYEDELIPLFEPFGTIWELRLMLDPATTKSRGYAFITYCLPEDAKKAAQSVDNHEIRHGKKLKVNISEGNCRLFVGNIPKTKSKANIFAEFENLTEGLNEVIVYPHPDNANILNRGFAFLDFDTHKSASLAKKKFGSGRVQVFGCNLIVEWAEAQEEPSAELMSKVKVLYIKNIESTVTEEELKDKFVEFGEIERVKVIKDFAFVHFEEREDCLKSLVMNKQELKGQPLDVSLAKPLNDMKKNSMNNQGGGGGRGGRGGGVHGGYDHGFSGGYNSRNNYSPRRGRGQGGYGGNNNGGHYGGNGGYGDNYGSGWEQENNSRYDNYEQQPRRSFQKSIDYGHGTTPSAPREYTSPRNNGSSERDGYNRSSHGGSQNNYRSSGGGRDYRESSRGRRGGGGGDSGFNSYSSRGSGASGYKRKSESSSSWSDDSAKKRNSNGREQNFQTDDYSGSQW